MVWEIKRRNERNKSALRIDSATVAQPVLEGGGGGGFFTVVTPQQFP